MKSKSELVSEFPINEIKGFFYERTVYDKDRMTELTQDVQDKGVIKNISIAKILTNGKGKTIGENMVVAGFRTTKACIGAKLQTVPARVFAKITVLEATDILLSENIHTEEMNDFDIGQNIKRYVDAGISQKDIAKRINRSEPYVSQYLQLTKDSKPIQQALVNNKVFSEKHARIVRQLPEKLHVKAVKAVEGKTVRESIEEIDKIKAENKVIVLKQEIKDLKAKRTECDKAEKTKLELEQKVAEFSGKMKALSPSNMDTKRLVGKLERIRIAYLPQKERLSTLKARKKELMKIKPEFDVGPVKKQRQQVYNKLAKKTETMKELKEQISKLQTETRKLKDEAKRLTEKIETVTATKQELTQIDAETATLTSRLADMNKSLGTEIKDYEKLVKQVETGEKELLQKREQFFTQIADLKHEMRSLNGKIANRSLIVKKLADKQAELRNLNA